MYSFDVFLIHLCVFFSYMLMGGAVNVWMLHVGRFLTGVAGGMTAASIPVGYHGYTCFSFFPFHLFLSQIPTALIKPLFFARHEPFITELVMTSIM